MTTSISGSNSGSTSGSNPESKSASSTRSSSKLRDSTAEAFAGLRERGVLRDGITVMVGGFGLCGIPEHLILALRDSGVKNLTCISNNAGVADFGLGLLLQTRQISKMISSYVGENEIFEKQYLGGELEVEFNPQGTLAERIRAGAAGIPAFYTATGAGTLVAKDKETREFFRPTVGRCGVTIPGRGYAGRDLASEKTDTFGTPISRVAPADSLVNGVPESREYVLETGLFADLALVKAFQADPFGNLTYRMTARNFNPMMAQAAGFVIAEVDEIVALGALNPDYIHTPGNYVDRAVKTVCTKRIEQRTIRPDRSTD